MLTRILYMLTPADTYLIYVDTCWHISYICWHLLTHILYMLTPADTCHYSLTHSSTLVVCSIIMLVGLSIKL